MSEARFSYTVKDHKGNLYTMRGDSEGEFKANVEDGLAFLAELNAASVIPPLAINTPHPAPTMDQTVQTVQQTFPGAVPQPAIPNVGQPAASPGQAPPGKKWVPAGVSKTKTNADGSPRAFAGFWANI